MKGEISRRFLVVLYDLFLQIQEKRPVIISVEYSGIAARHAAGYIFVPDRDVLRTMCTRGSCTCYHDKIIPKATEVQTFR